MMNPDYMRPMFVEPMGRVLLVGAFGLQLLGFMVIRRITDVEF